MKKDIVMTFSKITEVDECYHRCPFFQTEGNMMSCGHPHWRHKAVYSNCIIDQDNSRGRVPDECPLRPEGVKMVELVELSSRYTTTTTTTTKAPKADGLPDGFKFGPSGRVVLENPDID